MVKKVARNPFITVIDSVFKIDEVPALDLVHQFEIHCIFLLRKGSGQIAAS